MTDRPRTPGAPPTGRPARRGAVGGLAVLVLLVPGCLLLQDPHTASPQYTFTAPLTDTVVNVGDTTGVLSCDLRVDGAPLPCSLAILFTGSDVVTVQEGPRLVIERAQRTGPFGAPDLVPGVTRATMRPLNVQVQADTIERLARIRAVVPRLAMLNCGEGEDTLTYIGQVRLYLVAAKTRDGRLISGASWTWSQESGEGVAGLISAGTNGWVEAIANGVAVFKVTTDTATTRCRVRVQAGP